MNEKFNKNMKVEKLTKRVGRGVRLIVIGPLIIIKWGLPSPRGVTIQENRIAIYCDIFFTVLRYIPFLIFSVKLN